MGDGDLWLPIMREDRLAPQGATYGEWRRI